MAVDCQGPLSMGFSKQEYWRGLPLPSPLKSEQIPALPLKLTVFVSLGRVFDLSMPLLPNLLHGEKMVATQERLCIK